MKPGPFCVDKMCRNRCTRRCSILSESFWLTPGRNILLASKEPESENHVFFASWSTSRSTIQVGTRSCMVLWDHDWIALCHLKHLCSISSIYQLLPIHRSIIWFFRRQSKQQQRKTSKTYTNNFWNLYQTHKRTWKLSKVWNLSRPKYPSPNTTWKPLPIIFHFAPPGLEIYASPRPNQPCSRAGTKGRAPYSRRGPTSWHQVQVNKGKIQQ